LFEKTKQIYGLVVFVDYMSTIASFDIWMSKAAHDIFTLVVIFLGKNWVPKHTIIDGLKHLKL
jgi:hypothetical protein